MQVLLSTDFIRVLNSFNKMLRKWKRDGMNKYRLAHETIGRLVVEEAKKRVPVDRGKLRSSLQHVTNKMANGNLVTDMGSNATRKGFPYPVVIEFGSDAIAGGAVKALGTRVHITDAEAIHDWPALRKRGGAGGAGQQMPFLRPAWVAVEPRALALINVAFRPPKQTYPSGA